MTIDLKNRGIALAQGMAAVALVTAIDFWTSWDVSLSLFYTVIVAISALHGGLLVGTIVAVTAALCWTTTNLLTGMPYLHWYAPYWNLGVRLAVLWLFAYLITRLKNERALELLAQTDPLTGVWNRRQFYAAAEDELKRASRYQHPFTLVYLDLDGFKAVNDTLGHEAGDQVLRTVAKTIQSKLRGTDKLARLGGDEFAILMPETDEPSAVFYLGRMNQELLAAMREHGWPVTFSIGVVTFLDAPSSVDDMMRRADDLMYSVKRSGKNNVKRGVFSMANGSGTAP